MKLENNRTQINTYSIFIKKTHKIFLGFWSIHFKKYAIQELLQRLRAYPYTFNL